MVLERLEGAGGTSSTLMLSRKPSMIKAATAGMLPRSFEEVLDCEAMFVLALYAGLCFFPN